MPDRVEKALSKAEGIGPDPRRWWERLADATTDTLGGRGFPTAENPGGVGNIGPADLTLMVPAAKAVMEGGALFKQLLKRTGHVPYTAKAPLVKGTDAYGLEPKMDRRQFFRRSTGQPARDSEHALEAIEQRSMLDKGPYHIEDVYTQDEIKSMLGDGYSEYQAGDRLFSKITDKYWNVDNPNHHYNPGLKAALSGWKRHLQTNIENEIRQGLKGEAKEAFDEGLDTAGEGTKRLVDTIMTRITGKKHQ